MSDLCLGCKECIDYTPCWQIPPAWPGNQGSPSFSASSSPICCDSGNCHVPGSPRPPAVGLSWQIPGRQPSGEGLASSSQAQTLPSAQH